MVSRLRCFIGGILFCFFTSSFALHATENDDLVKAMPRNWLPIHRITERIIAGLWLISDRGI